MTLNGILLGALAAAAVGGSIVAFALDRDGTSVLGGREIHAIDKAPQWLNSEPLTAAGLKGKVVLVNGPWVGDFLDEVCRFTGRGDAHDDQVDAVSLAYRMLGKGTGKKAYSF